MGRKSDGRQATVLLLYFGPDFGAEAIDSLKKKLAAAFKVEAEEDEDALLSRLSSGGIDALVLFVNALPRTTFELILVLKKRFPSLPLVAVGGGEALHGEMELLESGVHEVIDFEDVHSAALTRILERSKARARFGNANEGDDIASVEASSAPCSAILETDLDYYISNWSTNNADRLEAMGWKLGPGSNLLDFLSREDRPRLLDHTIGAFNKNRIGPKEYIVQGRDGNRFPVVFDLTPVFRGGRPQGVRVVMTDPAMAPMLDVERRRYEEQLQQAQKMEALSLLAAGAAHDLNNVLNTISVLASTAHSDLESGAEVKEDLRGIVRACGRGAELITRMLKFSRKGDYLYDRFSINTLIEEVEFLIKYMVPKDIEISLELEGRTMFVEGDASELNSCLFNICTNAISAMEGKPGKLIIGTKRIVAAEAGKLELNLPRSGQHVAVFVRDTGIGMDKPTLERIFEPFFTTKPGGKGTGLGLPMVAKIIEKHEGGIRIDSEPGGGTTVTLYLPVAAATSIPLISAILEEERRRTIQ